MKKNMYSLILTEDVINEIDRLAFINGTNRSNFIDGILAEYCRMVTPEMRIKSIFERVLTLCEGTRFLPSKEPGVGTMSLRTSLEYKYHPTVKYDVQLYRHKGHAFGQLRVGLRSQSAELLRVLGGFFQILSVLEHKYSLVPKRQGSFEFDGTKFLRTFILPEAREYSSTEIAEAINGYVVMVDEMLNKYLRGDYVTELDMEKDYIIYLSKLTIRI